MDTPKAKIEVGDIAKVISQEKTNEVFGVHSDMVGVGDRFLVYERYYNTWRKSWTYNDAYGFSYCEEDLETATATEDEMKFKVGDLVKVISHLETNSRFGYSKKMRQIGDTFTIKKSYKAPFTGNYYHCDKGYAYDEQDLMLVETEPEFEVGDKAEVISREETSNRFGVHSDMADVGGSFFIDSRYYNDYKGLWSYTDVNGFTYDERDLKKFVRPEPEFEMGDKVRVVDTKKTFERYGYNEYMKNVGDEFVITDSKWDDEKGSWCYIGNSFKYAGEDLKKFVRPEPEFEVGDKVRLVDIKKTSERHGYTGYMKNVGDEFVITYSKWHDENESWYYIGETYRYAPEDLELVVEEEFEIKDLPQHVVLRNAKDENDRTFYFGVKRDGWDETIAVMKYDKGGVLSFVDIFTYSRMFNKTYTVVEEMAVTGLRYVVVGDVPPVGDPLEVRSGGTLRLNHLHEHLPF